MNPWFRLIGRLLPRFQSRRSPTKWTFRPMLQELEDRCVPATVTEFTTGITAASQPTGIVRGADGNLWFTEFSNNALGRITPAGVVTEFSLAALGASNGPLDIVSDPANNFLYFTEQATGKIGRINPLAGADALILASEMQSTVVPSGLGASLDGITVGPDGSTLWFTEAGVDRIGNVNIALTTINEFNTGITSGATPANIVSGPDGALWFTESGTGAIGRITTAGTVTNEFVISGSGNTPEDITVGPDGALWFTNDGTDQIGRITTAGAITSFQLTANSGPLGITSGPFNALYFTEANRDLIGRITTAGAIAEFGSGIITSGSQPTDITVGGPNLWFTEGSASHSAIGKLVPDPIFVGANPAAFPIGASVGGSTPIVNLQTNGTLVTTVTPIPGFTGELRRATGDFNNDNVADTVWAAGPGGGPRVRVLSGANGAVLGDFFAFAPSFTGGVYVAAGDVNGDGVSDLIVSAGAGGGPAVKVIDGTKLGMVQASGQISDSALLGSFFAFAPGFGGGSTVAAGDVNGDGKADVVIGAGPGGGPHVKVIDGTKLGQTQANGQISDSALLASFFAYAPGFTGGVFVAAGDVNADGKADVITGAGAGAMGPVVRILDGTKLTQLQANGEIADASSLGDFYAYASSFTGGVRVDAVDVDGDGKADIVTGAGPGGGPHVKVFRATDLAVLDSFFAQPATFTAGVFV